MASQAKRIAKVIIKGFDRHFQLFTKITRGAKQRFESADWEADDKARVERIDYYDMRVREAIQKLREKREASLSSPELWREVKLQYMDLVYDHKQPELAESFYNSMFCNLFHRTYYNNRNIFVRAGLATDSLDMEAPVYDSYYPRVDTLDEVLEKLLRSFSWNLAWEDMARDIGLIRQRMLPYFSQRQYALLPAQIEILSSPFYRNKAAYLVGRMVVEGKYQGFVLPVLRSEVGELYVDAMLTDPDQLGIVFSFTRAYFMVDCAVPAALVEFLESILPSKTSADLYTAIGFQKQGKTLFYRDFLNHLAHSRDQFITAPGIEGMVMSVFTLPSYPYVFKLIKDKFAPPKDVDHATVRAKYQFVKTRDRVGRMADTLEFSSVAFPIERISPPLLEKLKKDIPSQLEIDGDYLIIQHLYIEKRMVPLNIFIEYATDEQLEEAVRDYGNSIKDMARANIFPGDMLIKNFGVTRQNRVIFYDYDELCTMEEINFRRIPPPRTPEQEMATEPWYAVAQEDFFPEEFERFVMSHPRMRELFRQHHSDLLDPQWWKDTVIDIDHGKRADVFPYSQKARFKNLVQDVV